MIRFTAQARSNYRDTLLTEALGADTILPCDHATLGVALVDLACDSVEVVSAGLDAGGLAESIHRKATPGATIQQYG